MNPFLKIVGLVNNSMDVGVSCVVTKRSINGALQLNQSVTLINSNYVEFDVVVHIIAIYGKSLLCGR